MITQIAGGEIFTVTSASSVTEGQISIPSIVFETEAVRVIIPVKEIETITLSYYQSPRDGIVLCIRVVLRSGDKVEWVDVMGIPEMVRDCYGMLFSFFEKHRA